MRENKLVYDTTLMNKNRELCLIVDDIHKYHIGKDITEKYDNLAVICDEYIVDTKYEIIISDINQL